MPRGSLCRLHNKGEGARWVCCSEWVGGAEDQCMCLCLLEEQQQGNNCRAGAHPQPSVIRSAEFERVPSQLGPTALRNMLRTCCINGRSSGRCGTWTLRRTRSWAT